MGIGGVVVGICGLTMLVLLWLVKRLLGRQRTLVIIAPAVPLWGAGFPQVLGPPKSSRTGSEVVVISWSLENSFQDNKIPSATSDIMDGIFYCGWKKSCTTP